MSADFEDCKDYDDTFPRFGENIVFTGKQEDKVYKMSIMEKIIS